MDLTPTRLRRTTESVQNPATAFPDGGSPPGSTHKDWLVYARYVLALAAFIVVFLMTDGSSTASQGWDGAPPWYLPVGVSIALFLTAKKKFYPLPLIASVIAAVVNYHRPLLSWSGLPGAVAAYFGYIAGAILLRGRWRIDPQLKTMRDVARYLIVMLSGAVWSGLVGTSALTADRLADRAQFLKNL